MNGPNSLPLPVSTPRPLPQIKKQMALPLPLASGPACDLLCSVEWSRNDAPFCLDLKRLSMFPLLLLSAVTMGRTYPDTPACLRIRMRVMGAKPGCPGYSRWGHPQSGTRQTADPQTHTWTWASFRTPADSDLWAKLPLAVLSHHIKKEITDILEYPYKLMELIY